MLLVSVFRLHKFEEGSDHTTCFDGSEIRLPSGHRETPRRPGLGFFRFIANTRNNLRALVSHTRVSPFPEPRHPRFGPLSEIDPEIANVSVVSPDDSISGYEPVPFALANKNVMFPFGVGDPNDGVSARLGGPDGFRRKRLAGYRLRRSHCSPRFCDTAMVAEAPE
jgi:hypothetical protein